jgi:hypothetical protein
LIARLLLYRSFARFVTRGAPAARAAGVLAALAVAAGHLAASPRQAADPAAPEPAGLLRDLGFSVGEIRSLDRGLVISRGLDPTSSGEIAVAGAVRVQVPRTYFLQRIKDIVGFKQDEAVLEIGVFNDPPSLRELAPLTLSEDDLRSLESCRSGDCAIKLSAPAIEEFGREVDWTTADAAREATEAFKSMLLSRTRTFLRGGPAALDPYADGHSQPFLQQVNGLLDASSPLFRHAPEFRRSIETAPVDAGPGVETVTYWSKEKAAFKPIISLTHMTFYTTRAAGTTMTFGSSVNFYSSHYLDASIGATIAVEPVDAPDAVYVIYVNRSRVDALHGLFSGLRRWGVQREARGGLKDRLEDTRNRLEAARAQ